MVSAPLSLCVTWRGTAELLRWCSATSPGCRTARASSCLPRSRTPLATTGTLPMERPDVYCDGDRFFCADQTGLLLRPVASERRRRRNRRPGNAGLSAAAVRAIPQRPADRAGRRGATLSTCPPGSRRLLRQGAQRVEVAGRRGPRREDHRPHPAPHLRHQPRARRHRPRHRRRTPRPRPPRNRPDLYPTHRRRQDPRPQPPHHRRVTPRRRSP